MTALDRAFTLANVNRIPLPVCQDLNLHMARSIHKLFDIDGRIAKRSERFRTRIPQCAFQLIFRPHQAKAFTTTASRCFEHDGITNRPRNFPGFFIGNDRIQRARNHLDTVLGYSSSRLHFGSHEGNRFR